MLTYDYMLYLGHLGVPAVKYSLHSSRYAAGLNGWLRSLPSIR